MTKINRQLKFKQQPRLKTIPTRDVQEQKEHSQEIFVWLEQAISSTVPALNGASKLIGKMQKKLKNDWLVPPTQEQREAIRESEGKEEKVGPFLIKLAFDSCLTDDERRTIRECIMVLEISYRDIVADISAYLELLKTTCERLVEDNKKLEKETIPHKKEELETSGKKLDRTNAKKIKLTNNNKAASSATKADLGFSVDNVPRNTFPEVKQVDNNIFPFLGEIKQSEDKFEEKINLIIKKVDEFRDISFNSIFMDMASITNYYLIVTKGRIDICDKTVLEGWLKIRPRHPVTSEDLTGCYSISDQSAVSLDLCKVSLRQCEENLKQCLEDMKKAIAPVKTELNLIYWKNYNLKQRLNEIEKAIKTIKNKIKNSQKQIKKKSIYVADIVKILPVGSRPPVVSSTLLAAAANGKLETVQWLLQSGASLTERDNESNTALLVAAANGKLETVQWLLQSGASLTERNQEGNTALLLAAWFGKHEMMQWLLQNGASVHERSHAGEPPLVMATTQGRLPIVEWLLQEENVGKVPESTEDYSSLYQAAWAGRLSALQSFLATKRVGFDARYQPGWIALLLAAARGHKASVQALLSAMDSSEKHQSACDDALLCAAYNGQLTLAQWLASQEVGASLSAKNAYGETALLGAAKHGHLEVVQWLVSQGVALVEKNIWGKTALDCARVNDHIAIVTFLKAQLKQRGFSLGASEEKTRDISSYQEVDVPDDNNCLFWSAALATLLPTLNNGKAFTTAYERLFGNTGSITLKNKSDITEIKIANTHTQEGIRAILRTYDCQQNTPLQFQGNVFGKLVCGVFRNRVVDYMEQKFDEATKESIRVESGKSNWASYAAGMRSSTGWGGEPEIRAISQLLQINIQVSGQGYRREYQSGGATTTFYLIHANAQSAAAGRNHYHFGLRQDLYQAHIKPLFSAHSFLGEGMLATASAEAGADQEVKQESKPGNIASVLAQSMSQGTLQPLSVSQKSQTKVSSDQPMLLRVGLFKSNDKFADQIKGVLTPTGLQVGAARDRGDCFFDSVAQGLEAVDISIPGDGKQEPYKRLRMLCKQYASNPSNTWAKEEINTNNDVEDFSAYVRRIEFTQVEMDRARGFSIWGRDNIEGRMLCDLLGVRLHIVQFNKIEGNIIPIHRLVDGKQVKEMFEYEIDYRDPKIIHIAIYGSHFVPLLSPTVKLNATSQPTFHP